MSKANDGISYKIGYGIGYIIVGLLSFLWNYGIVTPFKRDKILRFTYILLAVGMLFSFITDKIPLTLILSVTFLLSLILGIKGYHKEKPVRKMRKYFNTIFDEIKLYAIDGHIPYYLYDYDMSNYVRAYFFNTLIPLSEWYSKKKF